MMMQTPTTTATAVAPQQTSDASASAAAIVECSVEMSDRGFGGNRWPRQETLALLKIRSDMDIAFRDASVKGPLWDDVSRKMAELGYQRSAKKCKEKFENVYKYHKRTKEGRTGKSEGKTYRFFDQLEALQNQSSSVPHHQMQTQSQSQSQSQSLPPLSYNHSNNNNNTVFLETLPQPGVAVTTVTSTMPHQPVSVPPSLTPFTQPPLSASVIPNAHAINVSSAFAGISGDFMSDDSTFSSSTSTSSDAEVDGGTRRRRKRKRKWKDFFERLMKQVVDKQEELQKRFLEAVEKREHERIVREEAWRAQETARISREREILAQERSMAAAKDAAVMSFLQKLSENPNLSLSTQMPHHHQQQQQQPQPKQSEPPLPNQQAATTTATTTVTTRELDMGKTDNVGTNLTAGPSSSSSSRWPKVEIEALIKLRTSLETKYEENGPKGPLWEEISAGMRRLGFNRNAKRCKEKWENINKYFKKVKESNKRRPGDSKTCPYFHQLDALYRDKNKFNNNNAASTSPTSTSTSTGQIRPEDAAVEPPLMVQPEQQWPPAPQQTQTQTQSQTQKSQMQTQLQREQMMEDMDRGESFGGDLDHDEEDDEDDDDDGGEFEIVPSNNNKGVSLGTSG